MSSGISTSSRGCEWRRKVCAWFVFQITDIRIIEPRNASISDCGPSIATTRFRLWASTCSLISVRTLSRVRVVREALDPLARRRADRISCLVKSASGQSRRFRDVRDMSGLPQTADIFGPGRHFAFVPICRHRPTPPCNDRYILVVVDSGTPPGLAPRPDACKARHSLCHK